MRCWFDLPFMLPLEPGQYPARIAAIPLTFEHAVRRQESLDPRLAIQDGQLGVQRDQLGLLRYSALEFTVTAEELATAENFFFGRSLTNGIGLTQRQIRNRVALAICNEFLLQFRSVVGEPDVHSLNGGEIATYRFRDALESGGIRFYGGGITTGTG